MDSLIVSTTEVMGGPTREDGPPAVFCTGELDGVVHRTPRIQHIIGTDGIERFVATEGGGCYCLIFDTVGQARVLDHLFLGTEPTPPPEFQLH